MGVVFQTSKPARLEKQKQETVEIEKCEERVRGGTVFNRPVQKISWETCVRGNPAQVGLG